MTLIFDAPFGINGVPGGSVDESKIIVKSATIPTASEDNLGFVYQYVGETNSTYTHGYIYECKAVIESDTTTYAWERIDVQPGATRGRFLALWNCATGLAESNPPSSPYPYGVGDYYIIGTVGTTNYKPSGSSYVIGTASTTVETDDVAVNDTYYYDGTNWNLQKNTATTVDQTYDPTSPNAQSGTAVAQAIAGITIPTVNNATLTITQGGVSKGTFTANAGTDVTIALDSGVNIDNTTITENASNQLQASAVMNARTGTDALPIWQGTEQEWNEGVGTDWYNWKSDAVFTSEIKTGTSLPATRIAYGNGIYVVSIYNSSSYFTSEDGVTWEERSFENTRYWSTIKFVNNKFFIPTANNSNILAYSDDGLSWTEITLPQAAVWKDITYGNGTYVLIASNWSGKSLYSTDLQTWNEMTISPSTDSVNWCGVCYANGKFVTVGKGGQLNYNTVRYSTDGINWIKGQYDSSVSTIYRSLAHIVYANNKFIAVSEDNYDYCFLSNDGINWIQQNLPNAVRSTGIATDGINVVIFTNSSSDKLLYSQNLTNWSSEGKDLISYYGCYGDGKFVAIPADSTDKWFGEFSQSQCYTLEAEPTTSSTVYSEPNTASALTITSIGTGTITLSDNNTYTYTQSGDQTTYQSIGEAHPTWLCNINGVGVKIGNTLIADKTDTSTLQTTTNLVTSVSSSSTDTQYPSAKLLYDTVGNIEATLDAIIAQGSNS